MVAIHSGASKRKDHSTAVLLLAALTFGLPLRSAAEEGLKNCAELFPGKSVRNAPAAPGTADGPAPGNLHICERSGKVPFFALEYNPERYAPVWVSYRIAKTFGENGCASMTRDQMKCHFKQTNIAACLKRKKGSDPFHPEPLLADRGIDRLSTADFASTGHDRGHMAPNNSFSWHACGAYKTFTMANMAAQWGTLNRQLWATLEAQVLYWGIHHGPIYVVTGPIWAAFPSDQFAAIKSGDVNTKSFAKVDERLKKTGGRALKKKIPRPTGFYKLVYQPGGAPGRPDRAIAFLAPHTKQRNLSHWLFAAPITLVEQTAGVRFAIPQDLKGAPDVQYWQHADRVAPARWDVRRGCKAKVPVQGWMADRSVDERITLCNAADFPN